MHHPLRILRIERALPQPAEERARRMWSSLALILAGALLIAACGSSADEAVVAGSDTGDESSAPSDADPEADDDAESDAEAEGDGAATTPAETDGTENDGSEGDGTENTDGATPTDDEFTRDQALEFLAAGGLNPEQAGCVADGAKEITGSWNMTPEVDDVVGQSLSAMAAECINANTPPQPEVETIEEWVQGAADREPAERDGIYREVGSPPMTIDAAGTYEAVLTTADGEMRFELFTEASPTAVNNFVNLANDGFYDGVAFHRVLEDFMAQGGDPTGSGMGGPGYRFDNEYTEGVEFGERGVLAMANAGPNTNGSQFFITLAEAPWLEASQYTVFGQLTDGDDVLAAIDLRDPAAAVELGTVLDTVRIEES